MIVYVGAMTQKRSEYLEFLHTQGRDHLCSNISARGSLRSWNMNIILHLEFEPLELDSSRPLRADSFDFLGALSDSDVKVLESSQVAECVYAFRVAHRGSHRLATPPALYEIDSILGNERQSLRIAPFCEQAWKSSHAERFWECE